ncbi:hypothetical protein SAMN05660831_00156 [Thiohalospira halophila DSM 15071]|uniref:DUF6701 domain-containing protein n=1 Tax=Thiohalospira halophila DSM 15071 TaxID=1123397 RepID=A0A1I1N837_9GAMM|nr:hypothetical protein SAMN05660831_00156 [Thiohalospira halophila DSM 15071]
MALYTRVVDQAFGVTVRFDADDSEIDKVGLDLVRSDGGDCGEVLQEDWGSANAEEFEETDDGYEVTLTDLDYGEAVARARLRARLVVDGTSQWCEWFPFLPWCGGGGQVENEGCSSDAFTIRPAKLSLSATTNPAEEDLTEEDLTRSDWSNYTPKTCNNEVCQAAGDNFNLGIEALPTGQGFDAEILLQPSDHPQAPAWMALGTLSLPTSLSFERDANKVTTDQAAYTEAGLVAVDAHDDGAFAAVDRDKGHCVTGAADNTVNADGLVGCRTALPEPEPLGRFIPDHFAVVDTDDIDPDYITNRSALSCDGEERDEFTYLGETLAADVTLEARNVAEAATENYRGEYAPLSALDWSVVAPEAEDGHLDDRLELVRDTSGWEQGQASFTPEVTVARADEPDGPFTADVAFVATDADGVALREATLDVDRDGDEDNDHRLAGETILRYGRLAIERLTAATFSEVDLPLRAEYWDGDRFVENELDDCTPVELRYRSLARGGDPEAAEWEGQPALGDLALREPLPPRLEEGEVVVPFEAPEERGEVAVCADLENHAYLHRGANEDLPDVCQGSPRGSVWYGISSGNENVLYTREVFD